MTEPGISRPRPVAAKKGDLDSAAVLLAKAAGIYFQLGNQQCAAHCLETTAGWAQRSGRAEDAAMLLGSTTALRRDTGIPTPVYERFLFDQIMAAVRDELGDGFTEPWERGQALSFEGALE